MMLALASQLMLRGRSRQMMRRASVGGWAIIVLLVAQPAPSGQAPAQEVYSNSVRYSRGQSIQPVYEGWSRNPDGSFTMWFGYLNRNHEERLNIPVGPDNGFGTGTGTGEDFGQPEFFEIRRQQFAFKVELPATFPRDRDLVWTLKANGVTLKAYGSLWPVWEIDQHTISANRGSRTAVDFDEPPNDPPKIDHGPPPQTVALGKPVTVSLAVSDDGNPKPRADRGARVAGIVGRGGRGGADNLPPLNQSLRVSWLQWRGPGIAKFDPAVVRVADGKATTTVAFDKPGTYVLRAYAEDASVHTSHDVRITVLSEAVQK